MKKILFILFACLATVGNVRAEEITVWEGSQASSIFMGPGTELYNKMFGNAEGQANLADGDVITFYFTNAADATEIWIQHNWDGLSGEGNTVTISGEGSHDYHVNASDLENIKKDGIRFRIGKGSCTFTKIIVTKPDNNIIVPDASEIILWSGSDNSGSIDFRSGAGLTNVQNANLQAKDTIKVYLSNVDEGDQIYIKECGSWSALNTNMSLTAGQQVMKMPLTQDIVDKILNNKMIIQRVGNSITYDYEIRYVTVAKYVAPIVPGYEVLYEGDPLYIDWASTSYTVPSEKLSNLAVGDIIHVYATKDTEKTPNKFAIWYVGWKNVKTDNNTTETVTDHMTLEVIDDYYDKFVNNSMTITGYYYYLNKAVLEHPSRFVSVTMSDDGLATFSHATEAIDLSWVDGMKAYKATVSGDKIVTERVTGTVAANTGLILQGENNATYRIPFAASGTALTGNVLAPTDGNPVTGYVLGHTTTGGTAFYKVSNKAVAAGKAYIPENAMTARQLSIDLLGDETTGITDANDNEIVNNKSVNSKYFNLQGQRVSAGAKGLVIVNGKKVFNK